MFKLKRRFPIAQLSSGQFSSAQLRGVWLLSIVPPSGSSARLPALLVLVLLIAAAVQVMLPHANPLPVGGDAPRQTRLAPPPQVPLVSVPAALAVRALFTPPTGPGTAAAPTSVLGGAVIAGTVQRGRGRLAVVQETSGRVRYVPPGGMIAGWRIIGLSANGVRLSRGTDQITAAYGAPPTAGLAAPALENSEDGQ